MFGYKELSQRCMFCWCCYCCCHFICDILRGTVIKTIKREEVKKGALCSLSANVLQSRRISHAYTQCYIFLVISINNQFTRIRRPSQANYTNYYPTGHYLWKIKKGLPSNNCLLWISTPHFILQILEVPQELIQGFTISDSTLKKNKCEDNSLSCVNNCEDLLHIYFFIPQFKFMNFIYS